MHAREPLLPLTCEDTASPRAGLMLGSCTLMSGDLGDWPLLEMRVCTTTKWIDDLFLRLFYNFNRDVTTIPGWMAPSGKLVSLTLPLYTIAKGCLSVCLDLGWLLWIDAPVVLKCLFVSSPVTESDRSCDISYFITEDCALYLSYLIQDSAAQLHATRQGCQFSKSMIEI